MTVEYSPKIAFLFVCRSAVAMTLFTVNSNDDRKISLAPPSIH